jgi:hypothetical protein
MGADPVRFSFLAWICLARTGDANEHGDFASIVAFVGVARRR